MAHSDCDPGLDSAVKDCENGQGVAVMDCDDDDGSAVRDCDNGHGSAAMGCDASAAMDCDNGHGSAARDCDPGHGDQPICWYSGHAAVHWDYAHGSDSGYSHANNWGCGRNGSGYGPSCRDSDCGCHPGGCGNGDACHSGCGCPDGGLDVHESGCGAVFPHGPLGHHRQRRRTACLRPLRPNRP